MLVNFGKLGQSFIAKILFGILTFSFVAWGISDVFKQTGGNDAAKVGKIRIPLVELDHSYRQYMNNLRARGMQISSEQAKSMQLAESVLKAKVQREEFSLVSRDLGLIAGDDVVAKEIRRQKTFQNARGEFDRDLYNTTLKQNGLREADYVSNLRLDTINNFLADNLKNNAVVPETLVQETYKYQNQTRSADLRILPYASVTAATPKPGELDAYLKQRAEHYKKPEMRRMTVAVLSTAALAQKIDVSDDEIQSTYIEYKEDLKTPEERNIQFISLPDQKIAQSIAEAARGGQKLVSAAKEAGVKDVKLNTLDHVKPGTLPEELDKAVFKMGRAETSDAIQTPLGWYVVQILAVKKAEIPALALIKDKIVKGIKIKKTNDTLPKTLQDLDDALAGGASLDELAKTYSLTITALKPVAADGTDDSSAEVKFANIKDALKIASDLPAGQTSSPVELKNNDYLIVRLDDIKPAHTPELKEIETKVTADWLSDNREKLARAHADELRAAWQNGKNFDQLAKQYGAQSATLNNVKRDNTSSSATQSPDLALAVFDLKKTGDIAVGKVANGIAIAKLTSITNADIAKANPDALKTIRDKMVENAANSNFDTFLDAAEKHYPVSVNEAAIQKLYSAN